ncbi:4Fe-4S dicluster domain-containing protein [Treponema sp.]|uniref:4Fe-4S dicluster domain-containing protein n=1 Tax=Treponema sp. TaxID=166 RepID=UPI00298EA66D|nr:4Fe-4S dicluster domain-containing protein [Treponema sp.]MCR5613279.1 hypothetical protein [Treponema sp.]
MILRIFLLFLFLILASSLLFFIYEIFIPAIKSQIVENTDPLFSEVELNYVGNPEGHKVEVSDKQAVVLCSAERKFESKRLVYKGVRSCALFHSVYGTINDCTVGCIGFGDCVKKCPQEAIIIKNGTAIVTKNCCGCGECISVCPNNLIKLFDRKELSEGKSIRICNADENSLTACNQCKQMQKLEIPEQKYFKFWKSWYNILIRK